MIELVLNTNGLKIHIFLSNAGRGVHMVVEQFLFVIGHSRINTHDEILLII